LRDARSLDYDPAVSRSTILAAGACILATVMLAPNSALGVTEISTCGRHSWSGPAIVTADLDCGLQLTIETHGSLALGGHTLANVNIDCEFVIPGEGAIQDAIGSCSITGPGTINGGRVENGFRVSVKDLVLTDFWIRGARVSLADTTMSGTADCNVTSEAENIGAAKITRSVLNGCSVYVGKRALIRDTEIRGNAAEGVYGAEPNARAKVVRSRVLDNGRSGIRAQVVRISGASMVTGNGTDPACAVDVACADVASGVAPQVRKAATCGTSYQLGSGVPGSSWDACMLD
jgi:hypothetical protein